MRRDSPRDLVVVFVPEYVVSHWWEQLLHNQSALRLKSRLLFTPGVVMASVPFQLDKVDHLGTGPGHEETHPGGVGELPVPASPPEAAPAPGGPGGPAVPGEPPREAGAGAGQGRGPEVRS